MKFSQNKSAFSLTEVLMAVGILSVGMMLIATMFPVGIYLTTVASERTMAAIVADGALAKIQLYDVNLVAPDWILPRVANCTPYDGNIPGRAIDPDEFSYPSADPCLSAGSQYYWSALCRPKKKDPNDPNDPSMLLYQVTVFVSRKTGANLAYPEPNSITGLVETANTVDWPRLIKIDCNVPADTNFLEVAADCARYINPPTTILDNSNGKIYKVINRSGTIIRLDKSWDKDTLPVPFVPPVPVFIWLIPPPESGGKSIGRNADIGVFQRIIKF